MNKFFEKVSEEKFFIAAGILMLACIFLYNSFFIPEVPAAYSYRGDVSGNRVKTKDTKSDSKNRLVNINKADAKTLAENLPGVGPKIAERIIAYRNTHGGFRSKKGIMNVKGIGEKAYKKFKSRIAV